MPLADMLPGRLGLAGRLPSQIGDLRGPVRGVVMLPRNLAWPGLRECDVSDGRSRRSMYALLLTQGKRNEVARLVNATLLSQDWPLIARSLDPRLSRWCERRLGLARAGRHPAQARPSLRAAAGPLRRPPPPRRPPDRARARLP